MSGNISPLNDSERYFAAHIADLQERSARYGIPCFSEFLTERERKLAEHIAKEAPSFYGGYEGASRCVCGFIKGTYAEGINDFFPVKAATFTFREKDTLSHRDFLGALLSLGIGRELVGDILTEKGYAVIFFHENAEELVNSIEKVGRIGVKYEEGITRTIPVQKTLKIRNTVSSLRLDCIVSAAANISREKSASLIKAGLVNTNFSPCMNVSNDIKENTVISIRGYGRFRLAEICEKTRKGRIHVVIEKYL